jgi:hypothetical protein
VVDTSMDSALVKAANTLNPKQLNNALVAARLQFYKDICARDASQNKFIKGWTIRANGFLVK